MQQRSGAKLNHCAGMFGGWVDVLVMRFVDILLSVPNLLLAVSIAVLALLRDRWLRPGPAA